MRIAIVGNNLYGQIFTRAAAATPGVDVVALCPEADEGLEPLASQFGLKSYASFGALLEAERPEAVLIASATARHEAHALAAFEAGAHVLVDRPIALTLEAADRMILAAQRAQRVLLVGHVLWFWPEYVAAHRMISRGDLGEPRVVTASRVSGLLNPAWAARLLHPTDGLGALEAHSHDIDLLVGWFGAAKVVASQGTATAAGAPKQVHSLLQFENGCRAGIEGDYSVPNNFPLSMYLRVVGDKGALTFTFRGALSARETAVRSLTFYRNDAPPEPVAVSPDDAYAGLLGHFVECIVNNRAPRFATGEQARASLATLLAIRSVAFGPTLD